jgi:hypothetical protein
MSNVVFVSEPDIYLANQNSILFVADSDASDFVVDLLAKGKQNYTVYWATSNSDFEWVINVGSQVDYILLDCKQNDFLTGFFIDKPNCFYYNNSINYNMININSGTDASDFVLQLLANEE